MVNKPINSWKQQEFIISAYHTRSGTKPEVLPKSFANLKQAGINLVIPCDIPTVDQELKTFRLLDEVGLPFLAASKSVFCEKRIDSEEAFAAYAEAVKDIKTCYGYYIWDEPKEEKFADIRYNHELVERYAPGKATYVCLLPSYGPFYWEQEDNSGTYCKHVDDFCEIARPAIISNDFYPYSDDDTDLVRHNIWRDMGYLRLKSLACDIPYWHVFQAICGLYDHSYGFLTPERIAVQMNCALAHGAAGVSYFISTKILVDWDGEPSAIYDGLTAVNKRVKAMGDQLLPATSVAVYHGGLEDDLRKKYYADDLAASAVLSSLPDKLLAGVFEASDGAKLLFIANKDYKSAVSGEIGLRDHSSVSVFNESNEYEKVAVVDGQLSATVAPGGAVLYRLE